MKKAFTSLDLSKIIVIILSVCIVIVSLFAYIKNSQANQSTSASIVQILEFESDGGFFYQKVEAHLDSNDEVIYFRIPIKEEDLETVNIGDTVYVSKIDTKTGELYSFQGHKRSTSLIWIISIFFILLVIMLGSSGLKYLLAAILTSLIIFSGTYTYLAQSYNIYIVTFILLGVISFISILMQVDNIKLASLVTISKIFTLGLIFLLNFVFFKVTYLTEIFYLEATFLDTNISLFSFWAVINTAVLFIGFGAVHNTTLDVAKSVLDKKKKHPRSSTVTLLKEGIKYNQLASARVISSLFFVFVGISMAYIVLTGDTNRLSFWDDPHVVQAVILFINGSISALLIGPITAILTATSLTSKTDNMQFKLKKSQ